MSSPNVIPPPPDGSNIVATGTPPPPPDGSAVVSRFDLSPQDAQKVINSFGKSAPTRFVQSFNSSFGIPESVQDKPSEALQGLKLAVQHPSMLVDSLGEMAKGFLPAQNAAYEQGKREMGMPGITPKIAGAIHMVESGIPFVGPALVNADNRIQQGDYAGAAGGLAGTGLQVAAPAVMHSPTPGSMEAAQQAAGVVKPQAPTPGSPMDVVARIRQGNQANVMTEIGKLPPQVVNAAENIFRAAAPTGMNKGFRANLYAALPDLADVGRSVNLAEAKGGIINPDMRVRATVQALRSHLDDMYQNERVPQIQRNADLPVNVPRDPNVMRGLEYLQSTAGDVKDAALAQKVLDGGTLNVAEADRLAIIANQTLKSYEKMTPEGKFQATAANPKVGGLKALDGALSQNLNSVLKAQGEEGLYGYERRYAALSAIRDQLESRMNAVELDQPGMIKKVIKPVASALTGGHAEIASASQAAVADVNIGRTLQKGLSDLAASSLTSKH